MIWVFYVVSQNLGYNSCDNIKTKLNAMSPGIIQETFSVSSNKIYLISEAIGPFFNTIIIEELKKSSSLFTIFYNKTTNKQMKERLGIKIKLSGINKMKKSHQEQKGKF